MVPLDRAAGEYGVVVGLDAAALAGDGVVGERAVSDYGVVVVRQAAAVHVGRVPRDNAVVQVEGVVVVDRAAAVDAGVEAEREAPGPRRNAPELVYRRVVGERAAAGDGQAVDLQRV